MQLLSIKVWVAVVWALAVCIAGVLANVNTLLSWMLLAGVAALPSMVMMWWWKDPGPSLSESIQEARR
jgi:hypothetical protein